MTHSATTVNGLEIRGEISPEFTEILTADALSFVAGLERVFDKRRRDLLRQRDVRQVEIDAGIMPDFLPETEHIKQTSLRVIW